MTGKLGALELIAPRRKLAITQHPTVYVIDKSGRVAWMRLDRNYREYPPNAEIRAALDVLR